MDEAISQAFTDSYLQVLQEIGVSAIDIRDADGAKNQGEYVCTIGLTGGIKGYLILIFQAGHLSSFSKHLNDSFDMGQKADDPAFMRESIAELANQLGGRSTMGLSRLNIDCLITPPTVITGTNVETMIPHLEDERNWQISTANGDFRISVLSKKR